MHSAVNSIIKKKSDGGGGAAAAAYGIGRDEVLGGDSTGTDGEDHSDEDDDFHGSSGGSSRSRTGSASGSRSGKVKSAESRDSISEGWTNIAPSAMAYPGLEVGMTK